jgi:hypothetical protein
MGNDIDIFDVAIAGAQIQAGENPARIFARTKIRMVGVKKIHGPKKSPKWTEQEDEFLRKNLGYLTDEQIGKKLGRSSNGVRLRWKRELHLTSPSKAEGFITGQKAARLLGLDVHKITHWCDMGKIPARKMAGGRSIRLIPIISLERWVITPSNWVYFDPKKIPDPRLRRLCELRAERWGDEWWSGRQVADFHGVDTKDVQRLIYRKELPAVQLDISKGGRHHNRAWANWYILRSDAVKAKFKHGKGSNTQIEFTPRAIAWMLKARFELNMGYEAIARSMGSKVVGETIKKAISSAEKP